MKIRLKALLVPFGMAVGLAGCGGSAGVNGSVQGLQANVDPGVRRATGSWSTDALIVDGSGVASVDTDSITGILDGLGMTWTTLGPSSLENMKAADFQKYGMIVVPGGTAKTISDSLSASTREAIRQAVVEGGVGYIGFCAGAFLTGSYADWGLKITGMDFPYYKLEDQGVTADMVDVSFPDGSNRALLWYGGPELTGFGQTVARYPDGNAAIAEAWVGKGFVMLSGPHPEGPQSWRDSFSLNDRDGLDFALAGQMFQAVLHQSPLRSF